MIVQPIGKFKLTYANGISQVKLLITQEDYKSIVRPILDNIAELEAQRSGINKKSKRYKEISEKLRELKKPISELGEFFTSTSPLGLALWSSRFPNLILPPQQGGGHFVRFEKLDLMKIRKVNSTIKRRVLREVSRECRKRNMMDKKGEIPNDIKDIWEAIKVLTKRNKQFAVRYASM